MTKQTQTALGTTFQNNWSTTNGDINPAAAVAAANPTLGLVNLAANAGGSPTARGQNAPNQVVANLFDNNLSTNWLDFSATSWVQYQFANNAANLVTKYTLTSGADTATYPGRAPKNWALKGSNDNGASWTTLDTQVNQADTANLDTRTYTIAQPAAYKVYKLDGIQSNGDPIVQLTELGLWGPAGAASPTGLAVSSWSSKAVSVSWNPVANATSYMLQRSTSSAFTTYTTVALASPTSTTALDIGLTKSTTYYYRVSATVGGQTSPPSSVVMATTVNRAVNDFDGDGKTDLAVTVDRGAGTGVVDAYRPSGGGGDIITTGFPAPTGSTTIAADYDGDGRADVVAVYNGTDGYTHFFWHKSSTGTNFSTNNVDQPYGPSGALPLVGDFDGDGKDDFAIYKPANGNLYINYHTTGTNQDIALVYPDSPKLTPVIGDFDGDGKSDVGLFWTDAAGGHFKYHPGSAGSNTSLDVNVTGSGSFGPPGVSPMAGDFDGDGKSDLAIYTTAYGKYYFNYLSSKTGKVMSFNWGNSTALVLTGDYDGDGVTDVAQYQPSGSTFTVCSSQQNPTFFANNANYNNEALVLPAQATQFGWTDGPTTALNMTPKKRT